MVVRVHRSFRFAPQTLDGLEERAQEAGLSVTALAERYLREGMRRDRHPAITFLDGPAGRRASVAGTGLDVWEVVETVRHNGGSVPEAAAYLAVPEALVRNGLRYYADHPDEIDAWVDANARIADREEVAARRIADAFA